MSFQTETTIHPLSQVNVQLTHRSRSRIDRRVTDLKLQSRSRYINAALEFFRSQPDETVVYWMKKVAADMKRERE